MSTLFRAQGGQPSYVCQDEVLFDAAGLAQFYIVDNNSVHRCADGVQAYWIGDNYLFEAAVRPFISTSTSASRN
jgi:hypothetical protein